MVDRSQETGAGLARPEVNYVLRAWMRGTMAALRVALEHHPRNVYPACAAIYRRAHGPMG